MPLTTTAQSYLTANLNALASINPELPALLNSAPPANDLEFADTPQGVPAGILAGRQLCSRHRPLDESQKLADSVDLIEHAVVVVFGFGMGWHVRELARRIEKAGLIVVLEPDLPLLRSVLETIDHSSWIEKTNLLLVTDAEDRPGLSRKLKGVESIIAQGVAMLEHPPSRARLGDLAATFSRTFSEHVTAARTTLTTTLVRSADTTRNLLLNIDHYADGPGIVDLKDAAAGAAAIVVSAGPSLQRNMHLLSQPGVRDRCVIIAVQTVLKPLLAAGIRPHFVTALDYHEISRRFYEDLDPEAVKDVTLVVEPKVHPVVPDSFPGPIRCCASGFLDRLLGDLKREMGELPAGATVAHLALYLARHLGCNPITLIGQDLGFTDGLYYSPGSAIDDVWAPELGPFNTIEMMQWQRIVRHRSHLQKRTGIDGRPIYSDGQMTAYLQQFERDFSQYAAEGVRIIDATEGGVVKRHAEIMPLAQALEAFATRDAPPLPAAQDEHDPQRRAAVRARLAAVRRDVAALHEVSRKTERLLRRMLDEQGDAKRLERHFARLKQYRAEVDRRFEAFELINHLNQLGVYRRTRADRRLHMHRNLPPVQRQRAQLERDLDNVTWLIDASREMIDQLIDAEAQLSPKESPPEPTESRPWDTARKRSATPSPTSRAAVAQKARIAALLPVDPQRNGLGIARSLSADFRGRSVLQGTLERLGRSEAIESIILIVPDKPAGGFDVAALIDRSRIGRPVEIERCPGASPFGPEQAAVAAARLWGETCWRGGIAGMSIYDEVLCPRIMHEIMERRGLDAAIIAGPDWPLIDPSAEVGCEALARRYQAQPDQHSIVFTQAPPGLCGCLISRSLMKELAHRNRLGTIGAALIYQPHRPQADPIALNASVQIDHRLRRSLIRATFDTPRCRALLAGLDVRDDDPVQVVQAIERRMACHVDHLPQHVILELCSERKSTGVWAGSFAHIAVDRPPLTLELAERMFDELGEGGDAVLTLAGAGDPLLHSDFDRIIQTAKQAGIRGVHVRTELLCDRATLDRLLQSGADVVSIDLHADTAATYERLMGVDRFRDVLLNIQHLVENRPRLTDHPAAAALALPWIVPRIHRCAETIDDIETFFDRWQATLGTALIEGDEPLGSAATRQRSAHAADGGRVSDPALLPAVTPERIAHRERARTMCIRSDGVIPGWGDWNASAGDLRHQSLADTWGALRDRRSEAANRSRRAARDPQPAGTT